MKKIYIVQASAVYGENIKTAYLPYAAGCLMSYAFADDEIKKEYSPGRFIFTRENPADAVESLEDPYLVGFSSYIWNMEYNKRFAEELKKKYPDCKVVFGGHNVNPSGEDLNNIPEADIIIHGEGEVPFKALLSAFAKGEDLSSVPGISFRENGRIITTEAGPMPDISTYPSPYTEGWFDDIINNSGISPSIIWETNRGCPNCCAFCDWGALKSKVRQFPMERIEAELKWMAEKKVEYVYCADANFGLFERDSRIADMIIASHIACGYPAVFKTNYTKNKDDVVFEISSKLIKEGIGKSPTLSFQSLSSEVMENIGRSNMQPEHFASLMSRYNSKSIPVYSELIIALPGESYDSFTEGIEKLLDCGQHTSIGIYPCELLPNSLLGRPDYTEKFGIRAVKTGFSQYHIKPVEEDVPEFSHIITETNTMSEEDWKRSYIFSVIIQAFHNLALTRTFAVYLRNEYGIGYKAFYEGLISYLDSDGKETAGGRVFAKIKELTDGVCAGRNSFSYLYGDNEKLMWSYEEYMFISLAKKKDEFYNGILPYIVSYGADPDIINALIEYQKAVIKEPGAGKWSFTSDYDFYGYFSDIYAGKYHLLEKKKNTISTENPIFRDWDEVSKINVWYGRRDDAQLYTGKKNRISQIFLIPEDGNVE